MRRMGYTVHMRQKRYAHRELVRKLKGERALGRSRRGCEDSIKTNLKEIGTKEVDWIHLTRDEDRWWTLLNAVMNLRVP
jgi:hypothetical protein